eukprot:COSAG01_NODE_45044_length_413_cov_0.818471_1_plen_39_part_01
MAGVKASSFSAKGHKGILPGASTGLQLLKGCMPSKVARF